MAVEETTRRDRRTKSWRKSRGKRSKFERNTTEGKEGHCRLCPEVTAEKGDFLSRNFLLVRCDWGRFWSETSFRYVVVYLIFDIYRVLIYENRINRNIFGMEYINNATNKLEYMDFLYKKTTDPLSNELDQVKSMHLVPRPRAAVDDPPWPCDAWVPIEIAPPPRSGPGSLSSLGLPGRPWQ